MRCPAHASLAAAALPLAALLPPLAAPGLSHAQSVSGAPAATPDPNHRPYYSEMRAKREGLDPFRFRKRPYYAATGGAVPTGRSANLFHGEVMDYGGWNYDLLHRDYVPAAKAQRVPSRYHGDTWTGLYGGCRVRYNWNATYKKYETEGHCL